jgi:Domain of unknown function (DUF4276)
MVDLNRSLKIGVIAEQKNDVEVLEALTSKVISENSFAFKHFVGHGCGKLRSKCGAWANALLQRGCTCLVVLHDLDDRQEQELRTSLEASISNVSFSHSIVIIPIEELEAWLLCDAAALKHVFNMQRKPKVPANPEDTPSPKEFLTQLIARHSKTKYLNTVHNHKIAAQMELSTLTRCPSFERYPAFVLSARRSR